MIYLTPTLTIIMVLDTLYLYNIVLFCPLLSSKDKIKSRFGMVKELLVVQTGRGATYGLFLGLSLYMNVLGVIVLEVL